MNYKIKDTGVIISLKDGIAEIQGCNNAASGELLLSKGNYGIVLNVYESKLGVVFLTEKNELKVGAIVTRMKVLPSLNFNLSSFLGEIITPLGEYLTTPSSTLILNRVTGKVTGSQLIIEIKAPGILVRQSVYEPVNTGLKVIDGLIPIGKGQRELIIGDRQTGKTAVAVDSIINQSSFVIYQ